MTLRILLSVRPLSSILSCSMDKRRKHVDWNHRAQKKKTYIWKYSQHSQLIAADSKILYIKRKSNSKTANLGFEVLLSRESWPLLARYFIVVSLTAMDKAVFLLDPMLLVAVSGRFLLGLPCVVFVQDLHGPSVISRQEGPVLSLCDGTNDWLPCGRKGDIQQITGLPIRLPSWHSHHSSAWLSTGTDQQFRVTCKKVAVAVRVETVLLYWKISETFPPASSSAYEG